MTYNLQQRLNVELNSEIIEEITTEGVVTTYAGSSAPGANTAAGTASAIWQIQKIVVTSTEGSVVTTISFPNGDNRYQFIWDDRDSYSYS